MIILELMVILDLLKKLLAKITRVLDKNQLIILFNLKKKSYKKIIIEYKSFE